MKPSQAIRSHKSLIIFMDVFLILLFVTAAQKGVTRPKVIPPIDISFEEEMRLMKKIGSEYFLYHNGDWKSYKDAKKEGVIKLIRPIMITCTEECERIDPRLLENGFIVISAPISDKISYKFMRDCMTNTSSCENVIYNVEDFLE